MYALRYMIRFQEGKPSLYGINKVESMEEQNMIIESGILKQWDTSHPTFENMKIREVWDHYPSKTIVIPGTVKKIGGLKRKVDIARFNLDIFYPAFSHNDCVEEVTMSDSVRIIGEKAFEHCRHLKGLRLSNNLRLIDINAFLGCEALTDVIIPPSVTEIHEWAFAHCPNLVIHCAKGSAAEQYAIDNKIACVVDQ